MTIAARIGIIGGHGWLGNAMAQAAITGGAVDPARLTLSGRSDHHAAAAPPGVRSTRDNQELVERSEVVVLSVRPEQLQAVRIAARGRLVISVMAGVPAAAIAERTGAEAVVRALPNAAAAIGRSFTPWYATPPVSAERRQLVQTLLAACGEAVEVPREADIDYCVGLTGSGAAFPALLAQAMTDHAIAQGLPPDLARRAAKAVVAGASQLFADASGDPAQIVQAMLDYRGTTAAALQAMLDRGFAGAVAAGLEAAAARTAAMAAS